MLCLYYILSVILDNIASVLRRSCVCLTVRHAHYPALVDAAALDSLFNLPKKGALSMETCVGLM